MSDLKKYKLLFFVGLGGFTSGITWVFVHYLKIPIVQAVVICFFFGLVVGSLLGLIGLKSNKS